MKHLTRSVIRRAAAEYPVGSPELGLNDPVSAVVGGATSLLGAGLQYDAQKDATKAARQAEEARMAQMTPYLQAGAQALPQFQANIGKQPSYADVIANLSSDPAYQFELAQGQKAVQGSAAAQGLLRSGRTLMDLTKYAQGLAAQRGSDAYTRELNAFNNQQNMLSTLMNAGMGAAGAQNNLGQLALQQGQNRADLFGNIANTANNTLGNLYLANMMQGGGAGAGLPKVNALSTAGGMW